MAKTEDLNNQFTYHKPSSDDVDAMKAIRELAKELAITINAYVPECEELEIALQKVREASMWANAGISCHPSDD